MVLGYYEYGCIVCVSCVYVCSCICVYVITYVCLKVCTCCDCVWTCVIMCYVFLMYIYIWFYVCILIGKPRYQLGVWWMHTCKKSAVCMDQ